LADLSSVFSDRNSKGSPDQIQIISRVVLLDFG
jgi:hypothetical protein